MLHPVTTSPYAVDVASLHSDKTLGSGQADISKVTKDYRLVLELERCLRVSDALRSLQQDAATPQHHSIVEEALLRLTHRIAELEELWRINRSQEDIGSQMP